MTFSSLALNPEILKAIEQCGYTIPTPVQAKSIPAILEGKDVVASAQTGTGKTAAFVLPALDRLSKLEHTKKTRILILTPTRELANQITKAATEYGKYLKFNIVNLVGGMPYHQQIRELARGADIVVATPGRLLDHIEQKRVNLSSIEMLVLDEADRMLDMGFIEDVEYIAKLTPERRQTLLFSATVDKQLTNVVRHLLKNPVRVDLSSEKLTVPNIEQLFYRATSPHHKARLLNHFLSDNKVYKAIIFTATKVYADKVADQLSDEGYSVAALHGDLRQNVRNRTIDQLRSGRIQFLVATDVAARGIDISDVTHVFNYDMPRFCEDYVHRIGRTGRAGKSGIAISFVSPADAKHLQRIERYLGERVQVIANIDVGQNQAHPKTPREKFVEDEGDAGEGDSGFKKEFVRKPRIAYRESVGPRDGRPAYKSRDSDSSARKPRRDSESSDRPFRSKSSDTPFRSRESSGGGRSERPSFRSREDGDSPRKSFSSDRPKPSFRSRDGGSDRPERSERSSDRSERPAGRSFGDKPKSSFRSRDGESSSRSYSSERPAFRKRSESDDKPARRSFGDKPKSSFRSRDGGSDRPERSERSSDRSERPAGRSFGDRAKPAFRSRDGESRSSSSDRPSFKKRDGDDKPARRSFGDKPKTSFRPADSDRPSRSATPFKKRSSADGDKPSFAKKRSVGGKSAGGFASKGDRPLRKTDSAKRRKPAGE